MLTPTRAVEKRSRNGCLPCKRRRKRCDESFTPRSDGNVSCDNCVRNKLACERGSISHSTRGLGPIQSAQRMAPRSLAREHQTMGGNYPYPVEGPSVPQPRHLVTTPSLTPQPPTATSKFSTNVPLTIPPWPDSSDKPATNGFNPAFPTTSMPWPAATNDDMVESFLQEFLMLADVNAMDVMSYDGSSYGSMLEQMIPPSTGIPTSSTRSFQDEVGDGRAKRRLVDGDDVVGFGGDQRPGNYRSLLASDALENLLGKYSKIYEQFWHVTLSFTSSTPIASAVKAIVDTSRSSLACRASMVAVCLAYREIAHYIREMKTAAASHDLSAFDHKNLNRDSWSLLAINGLRSEKEVASSTQNGTTRNDEESSVSEAGEMHEGVNPQFYSPSFWTQVAKEESFRPGANPTPEQQLCTLFNVRWTLLASSGSKEARIFWLENHDTIERASNALAADRAYPQPNFRSLLLATIAWANILDAATVRGARTSYPLETVDASILSPKWLEDEPVGTLPLSLLLHIQKTTNLAADIADGTLRDPEGIRRRFIEVESGVLSCEANLPPRMSSSARVRMFSIHEIWRQSILIHLYQGAGRKGCLHPVIRRALKEILTLAKTLPRLSEDVSCWDMFMPWFLAASVAVEPEDRQYCLREVQAFGLERVNRDTIDLLKTLWQRMDETGLPQDWYDLAEEMDRPVNFFM